MSAGSDRPGRGVARLVFATGAGAVAFTALAACSYAVDLARDGGPRGIVALELAGTPARLREVVANMRADGKIDRVVTITYVDFAFAAAYGLALSAGCRWVSRAWAHGGRARRARAGRALATGALVAAALDWAENAGLLLALREVVDVDGSPLPALVAGAAAVKFTLATAAGGYCLGATRAHGASRAAD